MGIQIRRQAGLVERRGNVTGPNLALQDQRQHLGRMRIQEQADIPATVGQRLVAPQDVAVSQVNVAQKVVQIEHRARTPSFN